MTDQPGPRDHPALQALEPGETVETIVEATETRILVTNRRIAVAQQERLALDIRLDEVRRIQFDIERDRPATFVIVPEHPSHEPQVLAIPPATYHAIGAALAYIGQRLYRATE